MFNGVCAYTFLLIYIDVVQQYFVIINIQNILCRFLVLHIFHVLTDSCMKQHLFDPKVYQYHTDTACFISEMIIIMVCSEELIRFPFIERWWRLLDAKMWFCNCPDLNPGFHSQSSVLQDCLRPIWLGVTQVNYEHYITSKQLPCIFSLTNVKYT